MNAGLAIWIFSLATAVVAADVVSSDGYPSKPIRFVVPAAPGGASEVLARTIGQKLTGSWGQQLVIDHRAGAQGIIGSQIAANAAPDGYTIVIVATGYAVNPSLYKKLPYDTLRDFERVAVLATSPNVLVVHPSVPARDAIEIASLSARSLPIVTMASGRIARASGSRDEITSLATWSELKVRSAVMK